MKILFIGTAGFGLATLNTLLQSEVHEVVGVVTQPDRPVGRKQVMTPPPVKQFLLDLDFKEPIFQPEKLREESRDILAKTQPDIIVVVAYGQIIPNDMLEMPEYGAINIHGSLLPSYRGAVPIEAALLNGDKKTGVSILKMTPGLDDGPILLEEEYIIKDEDDASSLRHTLGLVGRDLLMTVLDDIAYYLDHAVDQGDLDGRADRTLSLCKASDLRRENAEITQGDTAETAWNKIRAFSNSSGAWLSIERNDSKQDLKILKAKILQGGSTPRFPEITWQDGKLILSLGSGQLELLELQLSGKKQGTAQDYRYLAMDA